MAPLTRQCLLWCVVHRLLYATSHVKGHPGSAGAGSQLTAAYLQGQRHLLDDSILEQSPCASSQNSLQAAGTNSLSSLLLILHIVSVLFAFVVLGLVSSVLTQEIGLEEHLKNDLFFVKLDAKP